jgi:putative oxidoreductase
MNAVITIFYDWSRIVAGYFGWAGPLAVRIVVGWVFLWSGWTKLPEFFTPLASGIEFVGGILLLVGLLTRFAAVPMMIVMAVAIISAKWAEVDSLETFLGFDEVAYFVMFAWLAIAGPGPVSVDHFVLKAAGRNPSEHGA